MGIRADLDASFDYEIVDEFYDHYTMMVESMEVIIIDLADKEMYRRSLDELFRVFHNIKSASGFLKIAPMNRLAKFVEEFLEDLRSNPKPINEQTVNWLLEVSDVFAQWQTEIREDLDLTKVKYSLLKIPDLDDKT